MSSAWGLAGIGIVGSKISTRTGGAVVVAAYPANSGSAARTSEPVAAEAAEGVAGAAVPVVTGSASDTRAAAARPAPTRAAGRVELVRRPLMRHLPG